MPVEDIIEVRANAARIAPIMAEAEMLDRAQVFVDARPARQWLKMNGLLPRVPLVGAVKFAGLKN